LEELENLRLSLSLSLSEGGDFQSNSAFEISDLELENYLMGRNKDLLFKE
jgi:hypothetical protein